jgi:enoyl-CoA hydratase
VAIRTDIHAHIGEVVLDRPPVNALDSKAWNLSRMFPLHKVRAAFFTGGRIDAAEAYRLGAVERLVPAKSLLKEARAFAALIAAKSRRALVLAKEALNGLEARDVDHGYRFEQGLTLEMYLHPDAHKARDTSPKSKGTAK